MKKLIFLTVVFAAIGAYAVSYSGRKEITINPGKQLSLGGMEHVVKAFEKKTGVKVNIPKVGGCGDSAKGLDSGALDAGAMCCPLNTLEAGRKNLVDIPVGRDALVFVVHKSNPADNLSTRQLRDIYQGRVTNWKEVGGKDAPIQPYAHIMCGTREEVMRQFLTGVRRKGAISVDDSRFAPDVINIKDETDNCSSVAADPNGIVPVSRSMVEGSVKAIAVDGVMPSSRSIAEETYPVTRYLYITTKGYPEGPTREFIDFLRSEKGQSLLAKEGKIVPLP
jgi:phosphate transport system substrate-binding protein